jgi:hypothetical protein
MTMTSPDKTPATGYQPDDFDPDENDGEDTGYWTDKTPATEEPASMSILFSGPEGEMPKAILAHSFAAFWVDEFETVHFLAVPDEWWSVYFDGHDEDPAQVVRDAAGRLK